MDRMRSDHSIEMAALHEYIDQNVGHAVLRFWRDHVSVHNGAFTFYDGQDVPPREVATRAALFARLLGKLASGSSVELTPDPVFEQPPGWVSPLSSALRYGRKCSG